MGKDWEIEYIKHAGELGISAQQMMDNNVRYDVDPKKSAEKLKQKLDEGATERTAAYEYVESVVGTADDRELLMWRGWALIDAFMAGIKYSRESQ